MRIKFDTVITMMLATCALITTGFVIRREVFHATSQPVETSRYPIFIKDWGKYLVKGIRIGLSGAPVQIVEFADFECPFCRTFRTTLKNLNERFPTQVSLSYVHFPLPGHRFALPAARVAECAREQEKFEAMHDALFEGQVQFGLKPWSDYAAAVGVPDMTAFDACIKKTDPIPRVEEGRTLGEKLDVKGTPTIIINGWKLAYPPNEQELDQMVQRILAGKQPVDGKS